MIKQAVTHKRILPLVIVAGALAVFTVQPAAAQTAGNVVCNGCVASKDIKNNGVKSKDIKDGQVKNPDLAADAVSGDKIADGAVGSADLATEAVTNAKIAADAVDGGKVLDGSLAAADQADEGGADFAGGNFSQTLLSDDAVVRSVTITAPTDGVVIVNASVAILFQIDDGNARCSITTGTDVSFTNLMSASADGAKLESVMIAGTRGFDVTAGTTTFNLVCDKSSGTVVILRDNHITAMYFPTKY